MGTKGYPFGTKNVPFSGFDVPRGTKIEVLGTSAHDPFLRWPRGDIRIFTFNMYKPSKTTTLKFAVGVYTHMDSLTIFSLAGVLGLYLLTFFTQKDKSITELRILTVLMGICAVCCILTDESLNASTIGLLPIFPTVFVMLHSIIALIWEK